LLHLILLSIFQTWLKGNTILVPKEYFSL